jgi:pantoate--beta-alanine ligase
MRRLAEGLRACGKRIAFVPTMGCLHEGHAELVRLARRLADSVVVSIFVNPTQFGPGEDLSRYPRDFARDRRICVESGASIVFYPDAADMYPPGSQTVVRVTELERGLCGESRPGHFAGVATVVAKLFNIVKPHVALFGEKDRQQLEVIRRMAADLDTGIRIVGVPTVREPGGLAMSSRNIYLSPAERETALALPRSLIAAEKFFNSGGRSASEIRRAAMEVLDASPGVEVDYVEVRGPGLEEAESLADGGAILAAVRVGRTRLIDNRTLGRTGKRR